MSKEEKDVLIIKLFENKLSEQEKKELLDWLKEDSNLAYFNEFVEMNHLINSEQKFDHKKPLEGIRHRISGNRKRGMLLSVFKYAAVFVLLIGVSYFFFLNKDSSLENEQNLPVITDNKIEVGSDKAILTLANGDEVSLDKEKEFSRENIRSEGDQLIYESNAKEKKEVVYNELTIPRGGQFSLKLADGTKVWLNSDSKLRYPIEFTEGSAREVELLYGEAYFDVYPSTAHSGDRFKVIVNALETEVLGTQFNTRAYKDEDKVYTTLVEGAVELKKGALTMTLKPNEQASIGENDEDFEVETLKSLNELLWREGVFSFKHKPLDEIMKVLSRWYDMEVEFESEHLREVKFTGVLSKNQSIEEIMHIMHQTNNINYDINQKTLTVK